MTEGNNKLLPFILGFASATLAAAGFTYLQRKGQERGNQQSGVHQEAKKALESSTISEQDDDDDFVISKKLTHPHALKTSRKPAPLEELSSSSRASPRSRSGSQNDEIPSPVGRHETHMDIGVADGLHDSLMRPCFKSLEAAALVLRMARSQKDVRLQSKAMTAFFTFLEHVENSPLRRDGFGTTQVLVVEGLNGCGKTTLLESLVSRGDKELEMQFLKLPDEVLDVADTFSSMPFAVAVAFEFTKLYMMGYLISRSEAKVVLIEKYYHDCFARSLLDHGLTIEDITSDPNTTLFDWPQDLPKPTLVLYMTVSTDTRLKRRVQAGASPERSSQRASVRDSNLQTIHSLIRDNKVVAIDANGTASDVASTAFQALEAYGMRLRPASASPQRVSLGVYGAMADVLPASPTQM